MRFLITGKGSYVGTHIKQWLEKTEENIVDELDMLDAKWKDYDFIPYDTVIHVAAIVHRKNDNVTWNSYYEVNTKLAISVALKAKLSGVKQFIFFSTMAVYGQNKKLPHGNIINKNTQLRPYTFYGRSKLEAELQIQKLNSEEFLVSIVRPPNIYGAGCPGNYIEVFINLVKLLPVFPKIYEDCKQGFLYIDNLCEYIRLLVIKREAGIFCPQDGAGISTYDLISMIGKAMNKKIIFLGILGKAVKLFESLTVIKKLYGGISYDKNLTEYPITNYNVVDFEKAIKRTITKG